jgi:enoyl-CoA hydratase/carnithine racemase
MHHMPFNQHSSALCKQNYSIIKGKSKMPSETSGRDPVLFKLMGPHVALVTLNRPEKRNAINPATSAAMEAIVRKIEADSEIRVVILTSSDDRVFCAGADLAAIAAGQAAGIDTPNGGFAGFVFAQRTKPWIAAVEGMALAGGTEICLACDMIVASENARFGLPEVKRGLMAGAGGLHRLSLALPINIAKEAILTGEPFDAEFAHRHGLVNRLVSPGEALATAKAIANTIGDNAPLAVQYSLSAIRASAGQPDGAGRAVVAERFATLRRTEDYQEGPRAFVEKRAPIWKGR